MALETARSLAVTLRTEIALLQERAEVLSFYKSAGGQAAMQAINIFKNMRGHGDQSLEYLVYHYNAQYINLANAALNLYQNIMNDMGDDTDAAYIIPSGCTLS